jgi:alpha-D-ribose 1-methylphosphonate 5-triphosphate synthase subunit PhnG
MENRDYVLVECALEPLEKLVFNLEPKFEIKLAKAPSICMTMIEAEDSVEHQPFFLGEAITTECQILVNKQIGYGICLGDEPLRSYCIAFIDAVLQLNGEETHEIEAFIEEHSKLISASRKMEYNQILKTKVDFKIMEQE